MKKFIFQKIYFKQEQFGNVCWIALDEEITFGILGESWNSLPQIVVYLLIYILHYFINQNLQITNKSLWFIAFWKAQSLLIIMNFIPQY